jgi:filamentous hemagglutinin
VDGDPLGYFDPDGLNKVFQNPRNLMALEGGAGGGAMGGGARPPSFTPSGAGRSGAFNAAKEMNGIPTSQQPTSVRPNYDLRGNPQPGRQYDFDVPAPGGGTRRLTIRDDSDGHFFGSGNSQNRGPHFNDMCGRHFDY